MKQIKENRGMEESFCVKRKLVCFFAYCFIVIVCTAQVASSNFSHVHNIVHRRKLQT
jgi:hypothetical protein